MTRRIAIVTPMQKLLLTDLDFPSLGFALGQAERLGYTVEVLVAANGRVTRDSGSGLCAAQTAGHRRRCPTGLRHALLPARL